MWLTSPEARELSPSLPISRLSYAMNNNNNKATVLLSKRQRERMEIQVLSLNYYSRKSRILEVAASRVRWNTQ